jgi:hypothetical protein
VQAFNRSLDDLIQKRRLPAADLDQPEEQMLAVAQSLLSHNFSALSQRRRSIRKATREAHVEMHLKLSLGRAVALGSVALIALFIVACAVSPEIRAKTREALLQIGHMIFTREPTDAQRSLAYLTRSRPTITVEETPVPYDWGPLSEGEASLRAGFSVLVPGDVPEQEWEKAFRPEWGNPKQTSWQIFEAPEGGVWILCDCFRFFPVRIHEQLVGDQDIREFAIDDARLTEVQVRGTRGYWIEEAPTGLVGGGGSAWSLSEDDIVWGITEESFLLRVEDSILFQIEGSSELSLSDLLVVAGSLSE